ncbi:glycoside hydrolase family 140 protein [Paenibacillus sp. HB172176]|uniref:glycoside hydrolase family 140 protein n=1 Tax=Paenibacillus sp. HB172176 TaxID=2493690 RepID=UPI001439F979|nr:glycoside hydrolase family 140 protein [Paenibacillus sp. HB172176]
MKKELSALRVSDNNRFLIQEDGASFFWLGDTAWELFHRLDREETELYLRNRAELGFTVVQAVALAELEGLSTPNRYGRLPLKKNERGEYDPSQPHVEAGVYDYWDHVDFVMEKAASFGIYIALLPTWGDKYHQAWGKGPEIFTESNAKAYGQFLGKRFADKSNIVWVLGGDRPLAKIEHFQINRALAEGIREADAQRKLITFHPKGGESSSCHVHNEAWLDFNMIQSGHGQSDRNNYAKVGRDYLLHPVKPTLDAEPCYEDHPIGFNPENGYFDAADVRAAAYYAVFAGGFGHTYGHHSVWCMSRGQYSSLDFSDEGAYVIMSWQEAVQRPGAAQMRHVRALLESRPFLERVPDQELLAGNYNGANYIAATRGSDYAFLYTPNGLTIRVKMGKITGEQVKASWFDPRQGTITEIGRFDNAGILAFTPPSSGRGNDWVLVLDSM